jgi:hypothetical protein
VRRHRPRFPGPVSADTACRSIALRAAVSIAASRAGFAAHARRAGAVLGSGGSAHVAPGAGAGGRTPAGPRIPPSGPTLRPVHQLGLDCGSNAVTPSIPPVARPALICVTRRTASKALERERSSSFCKLQTFFRSPPGMPCRSAADTVRRPRPAASRPTATPGPRLRVRSPPPQPAMPLPSFLRSRNTCKYTNIAYQQHCHGGVGIGWR